MGNLTLSKSGNDRTKWVSRHLWTTAIKSWGDTHTCTHAHAYYLWNYLKIILSNKQTPPEWLIAYYKAIKEELTL